MSRDKTNALTNFKQEGKRLGRFPRGGSGQMFFKFSDLGVETKRFGC